MNVLFDLLSLLALQRERERSVFLIRRSDTKSIGEQREWSSMFYDHRGLMIDLHLLSLSFWSLVALPLPTSLLSLSPLVDSDWNQFPDHKSVAFSCIILILILSLFYNWNQLNEYIDILGRHHYQFGMIIFHLLLLVCCNFSPSQDLLF